MNTFLPESTSLYFFVCVDDLLDRLIDAMLSEDHKLPSMIQSKF